jgi:hypothetical protein
LLVAAVEAEMLELVQLVLAVAVQVVIVLT